MLEPTSIYLSNAVETANEGLKIGRILRGKKATLLLSGAVGAGKTTFLQGLAKGLDINDSITSPTFALEQRYESAEGQVFTHIDLYRLSEKEAQEFILHLEPLTGIRAVEWAERVPSAGWEHPISISLTEEGAGRRLSILPYVPVPTDTQIEEWRTLVRTPPHIVAHCEAVAAVSKRLALHMQQQGHTVHMQALERAAALHDLFRFVDFDLGGQPKGYIEATSDTMDIWQTWKTYFAGQHHEIACANFLRERRFPQIASIVEMHGPGINAKQTTLEQKILYYADKRLSGETFLSLRERFEDLNLRYTGIASPAESNVWFAEALDIEQGLFPDGPPV